MAEPAGALHAFDQAGLAQGARGWAVHWRENREILFSLLSGVLLLAGWLGETFLGAPALFFLGVYLAAYVLGGWDVTRHAWRSLRERRFDTDLLMILAALGAASLGEFTEGALLLFLFSLGHALEERVLARARRAVHALGELTPRTALARRSGRAGDHIVELPVDQLQLADIVLVRPGVRLPVDGLVLAGRSTVDQAPVTGEAQPVEKQAGDMVFAGTVNGEGALEVSVTRLASDSTLSRVMRMVEEAQAQKSPTQRTVERFERILVPAVLGLTALVILLPPFFGVPFHQSFMRAMTLLVAASPCALALGTPSAVLAGVARAARGGVLVKGGLHLENLGRIRAIAFDKTGTITHGRPDVTDVICVNLPPGCGAAQEAPSGAASAGPGMAANEMLRLAAAVERLSAHPLAQGVVRAAELRRLELPQAENVAAVNGRGLRGQVQGCSLLLGSRAQMEENGIGLLSIQRQAAELENSGKTLIYVAVNGVLAGLIALADTPRRQAVWAVAALKKLGVQHTILLTGDNPHAAASIAKQTGLTDFRAGLLPEDKLEAVRALVQTYGAVAMVGDGINDAPALAHATVGIAMGGAATDVALETADVALMGDDLSRLPFALGLGRATRAVILQNLALALAVIILLAGAALAGWTGMGPAVLLHEGSTLLVVLNALRLLGYSQT